jgi:PAS domain S-box-containing protein
MNDFQYDKPQLFEAFIKSAQYFVRLKTQQDIWEHLAKFITAYFPADWTAFVQRDSVNKISIHHCTLTDGAAAQRILTDEARTLIEDVLDSGFLASQVVFTPDPSMTAFLPIVENYQTENVMLIGHKTTDPFPTELLNIYLAIAGLAGTTLERLHNERELIRHRAHLEELVEERTAELAKAKRQNELILHSVSEGICGLDLDGRIAFVNPFAAQMIGWDPAELIGREAHATFHHTRKSGCSYPAEECLVYSTLKNGITKYAADEAFLRKDGTQFPVELTTAPIMEDDCIVGAVVVFRDITERKAAEEELRKARDELEIRVRERTAELSEAKEELEVANEELQVELEEHQKLEIELSQSKQELEVANEELQVELEQHRKLEADLVKAKETAEEAVNVKAAFMANMSHELRTPMNAVIGMTSLLLETGLDEEQRDFVETIRTGGESLMALISDILDFSRVEKEKVELEHQPLSLRTLVEESLDLVATQANDKDLNLSHTIKYGTPDIIIGDPGRLRQILVNLLSNAVKFTDVGDVSVSVSSKAIESCQHRILFKVMDTGIGIPQEKMDKLFQPFGQLEMTISRKRDGAGLGLAISKGLVELMGGKIWVESNPGAGSTFYFAIPAEVSSGKHVLPEMTTKAVLENLAELHPLRILVAEDSPSNQKVLLEMLRKMSYRADAVADGREVLQALERQPYDLVLMDIRMPEMDGIAASREIRKRWPDQGPRIIAITAYALAGDREKCLNAGMDGYISKPVQIEELKVALSNCQPFEQKRISNED